MTETLLDLAFLAASRIFGTGNRINPTKITIMTGASVMIMETTYMNWTATRNRKAIPAKVHM